MFKLSIFHNKCQIIYLNLDAYLKNAFVILTRQVQTYLYVNCDLIILFEDFCQQIKLFFEGPE